MEKHQYNDLFPEGDSWDTMVIDINILSELLCHNGIIQDPTPLVKIEYSNTSTTEEYWSYEVDKLIFHEDLIKPTGGTIPTGLDGITLSISMQTQGYYIDKIRNIMDPLAFPCTCDIEIYALHQLLGEKEIYTKYSAWHFDKHIPGSHFDEYLHPEYHWTYGGKKLEQNIDPYNDDKEVYINLGDSFVLPAPRINHPPFDIILVIDYVIRNYISATIYQNLIEESLYINILKRSQFRLWRPYAILFASHWLNLPSDYTFDTNFNINKIFPELY